VGAFGEKLRKQREQRGLALDAISNSTKISTRMLRALEDEHFDQLPGGVFNKGFVRAYARQVGLDEEETITDYLAALRESQVQSQKILPDFRNPGVKPSAIAPLDPKHNVLPASKLPAAESKNNASLDPGTPDRRRHERRDEARRNQLPSNRGRDLQNKAPVDEVGRDRDSRESERSLDRPQQENQVGVRRDEDRPHRSSSSLPGFITLGAAAGDSTESVDARSPRFSRIVLASTLLLLTVGLAVWNSQRHRASASKAPAPSNSSPSPLAAQSPAPTPTSTAAASRKTASASAASTPSAGKSSGAVPSPTKSSTTGLSPKPAANPSVANSSDTDTDTVTHTPAPAAKPLSTFTLLIRADQTTWISIAADGKPVAHETLIAPAHTSVRATREVVVKAGNAAGVSFLLNGKEFPPQGNIGEVRSYVFDATGLRPMPQAQTPTSNR
jgi:cytoskeletal protein RodZ